jgi:hypothetical protein
MATNRPVSQRNIELAELNKAMEVLKEQHSTNTAGIWEEVSIEFKKLGQHFPADRELKNK